MSVRTEHQRVCAAAWPRALDAESYLKCLNSLAAGWAWRCRTPQWQAAVADGDLVTAGAPGLQRTWEDRQWTLTRPTPLASGGQVTDPDRAPA